MSGSGLERPVPVPSVLSAPHWRGCAEGQLLVQRCAGCAKLLFPPTAICNRCAGMDLPWLESSGNGTVYSYTVVHRPQQPVFEVPYVPAIVELEEGWHMFTSIVGCSPADVHVGMAVRVAYRRVSDEIVLPEFTPRTTI